jgi:hypothetical protein
MKKFIAILPFLLVVFCSYSQQLNQVKFTGASDLSYFSFITDQNVQIRISPDGTILEHGVEFQSNRSSNYYAPKLQPFMGRIEYYDNETADSAFRGKIKSIGTCMFTYYGAQERDGRPGKIRSIGRAQLDYYTPFDNVAFRGKLKLAGSYVIEYYNSLENEDFRGNLKSVGNTAIKYHSSFDDKLLRGKIKSIGSVNYNWGSSLDRKEQQGALKSGTYRQIINGITFILQ